MLQLTGLDTSFLGLDSAIYPEYGRTFLVYALAGKSGLALAEVPL